MNKTTYKIKTKYKIVMFFLLIISIFGVENKSFLAYTQKKEYKNGIEYILDSEKKTANLVSAKNDVEYIKLSSDLENSGYTLTSIGENAFSGSNIKAVSIPETVTVIKKGAFKDCKNLEYVVLNENLQTIEDEAFFGTGLVSLNLPSSVSYIGKSAFSNCTKLSSVKLISNITHIGESAFSYCTALELAEFNCSTNKVPDELFYGCSNLKDINLSQDVEIIGKNAFYACGFDEINLPQNLKTIEDQAFDFCLNIKEVTIPNGVVSIGNEAFGRCSNVAKIEIPGSVSNIGDSAFGMENSAGGTELKRVVCVKNSAADNEDLYVTWEEYGMEYPVISYTVSDVSVSGSIFGEYTAVSYIAVGILLIVIVLGIFIIFKSSKESN